MSSHETREESSTDPNTEICGECGESYSHTTTAGPSRSTRSCGCDVALIEVPTDTNNAFANTAIRAMNADGDAETAALIREGARGRLVADGGENHRIPADQYEHIADARDALEKVDERELPDDVANVVETAYSKFDLYYDRVEDAPDVATDGGSMHEPDYSCRRCGWHGDECDRRDHYPVCPECSRIVEVNKELAADGGRDWQPDPNFQDDDPGPSDVTEATSTDDTHDPVICDGCDSRVPFDDGSWVSVSVSPHGCNNRSDSFAVSVCGDCGRDVVEALGESHDLIDPTSQNLSADGGVPENFEELASTCESCGDNVDLKWLIEGQCLGCHYYEPDDLVADGGTAWTDLHAFKRDLLEAIRRLDENGETTYGLAIKRELERQYGEEVNHGRLYPNLDDLVDVGLVEKSELDKRTNKYELTSEAEAMLEQRARLLADACGLEQPVADGGESA